VRLVREVEGCVVDLSVTIITLTKGDSSRIKMLFLTLLIN
jgi:hypothetical protein